MPDLRLQTDITVVDGVNYTISHLDNNIYYNIIGTETLTSDWEVIDDGLIDDDMYCNFIYKPSITLGGNHIIILGTQIPDNYASYMLNIDAICNSGVWTVLMNIVTDTTVLPTINTSDIVVGSITNSLLASLQKGYIKIGNSSNLVSDVDMTALGTIGVGTGTNYVPVVLNGDATIGATGTLTIAAKAVSIAKMDDMTRGYIYVGNSSARPSLLNTKTNGYILIGNGLDLVSVPVTGDISITSGGVVTIDPTIAVWEAGAGLNSVQTVGTGCNSSGAYSVASGSNTISSGICSYASGITSQAAGDYSTAIGATCQSVGHYSITIGNYCRANSAYSIASGSDAVTCFPSSKSFSSKSTSVVGDSQKIDLFLSVLTTDATPLVPMTLSDLSTEIQFPDDCIANVTLRTIAVQIGGTSGTIGDCFSQNIEWTAKKVGGTLSWATTSSGTVADVQDVVSDVIYKKKCGDVAFGGTVTPTINSDNIVIAVTGENNKDISWTAYISFVWKGFRNFNI